MMTASTYRDRCVDASGSQSTYPTTERAYKRLQFPFECEVDIPYRGTLSGVAYAETIHDGEPMYIVRMSMWCIAFKKEDVRRVDHQPALDDDW